MINYRNSKTCEKCGTEFGCGVGGEERCWCSQMTINQQILQEIQKKYNDCLCPHCLQEMSDKDAS